MTCAFRERAAALHWTANAIREIAGPAEQAEDCVERLRLFVERAPVSLSMFGRDMRYLATSGRWKSDRGLDSENLSGRFHCDLFPNASKRWRDLYKRAFSGETLREELDLTTRLDGSFQWLSWEMWPWRTPTGEIGGILMLTEYLRAKDCAANRNADESLLPFDAGQCGTCASSDKGAFPDSYLSRLEDMIEKMSSIGRGLSDALNQAKVAPGDARPTWSALDRQKAKKLASALAAKAAAVARDAVLLGTLLDMAGRVWRGRGLN